MKSTPNPLNPQGSLLEQEANGKPHLRVGLIIAGVHVLLFVGILIQGCGNETPGGAPDDTYSTYTKQEPKEDEGVVAPKDLEYYSNSSSTNQDIVVPGNPGSSGTSGNSAIQVPQIGNNTAANHSTSMSEGAANGGAGNGGTAVTEYIVQKGDSFYKIAQDHGITVSRLTEANASFDPKKLRPGQTLKIPSATSVAAPRESVVAADGGSASGDFYVVKRGDTLSSIASGNKTTVAQLKSANGLKTDQIRAGQKLRIP